MRDRIIRKSMQKMVPKRGVQIKKEGSRSLAGYASCSYPSSNLPFQKVCGFDRSHYRVVRTSIATIFFNICTDIQHGSNIDGRHSW